MKKLPLVNKRGDVTGWTIVDNADYAWAREMTLYRIIPGRGYAGASKDVKGKRRSVGLHRLVLNARHGQIVDHINRDTLDNRRSNLRFCDVPQNQWNSKRLRPDNTSGARGIHFRKNKWSARISIRGKRKFLGDFKYKRAAIAAYARAARLLRGEFAS